MKYNKNEIVAKTTGYVETLQDHLTEVARICVFIRLYGTEDSDNPIVKDDDFITMFNDTVDDCKTALDNLNDLNKSPNQTISIDEIADATAPIGYLKIKTEKMYCNLNVDEWNKNDRQKGEKILFDFNMILTAIDDIDAFLYEAYPDAPY